MMDTETTELSFGAAMEELETILRRVEGEDIDIDELADELKRAAQLLDTCRAKIRRAEVEVSQIVQTLEEPEPQSREVEPQPAEADRGETASLFTTDD
jgi:exodeoxyribonuclease VII small subunit